MNSNGLKSIFFVAPILCALLACSGGADNDNAGGNADAVKQQEVKGRVAEWGQLVGLDSATAESELTTAGLIGQVGKNAALNETEAQAFLELTFARDRTFSDGIEELNRRNFKAFLSFLAANRESNSLSTVQPSLTPTEVVENPPGSGFDLGGFQKITALRQTAANDYGSMSAQALTLRDRILEGARILGFLLEPATARELLTDEGFTTLRNDFAAPAVRAIFARDINPDLDKGGFPDFSLVATEEQLQFSAEPLADTTFKVGSRFVSFYQFNAIVPSGAANSNVLGVDTIQSGISQGGAAPDPNPVTTRGSFKVIPAAENFFPVRDLLLLDGIKG